jgi:protein-L-isoaspartate(D-aspartate) O-methyltransferase
VNLVAAPFERGLPEQAPYDVIVVNGAVAEVPTAWSAQLAEGGRMVVIVRADNGVAQNGVARLYSKVGGVVTEQILFDAQTPYLPGMVPKPVFAF